jgi:hypothetical protein
LISDVAARPSEHTWSVLAARFTDAELIELVTLIGFYHQIVQQATSKPVQPPYGPVELTRSLNHARRAEERNSFVRSATSHARFGQLVDPLLARQWERLVIQSNVRGDALR